jgi:hypothetical protein
MAGTGRRDNMHCLALAQEGLAHPRSAQYKRARKKQILIN